MSFQVVHNLSAKERLRKSAEAKKWLQEQGELPDTETVHKTLLEVHKLTQELTSSLLSHQQDEEATARLAKHIQELLATIKI